MQVGPDCTWVKSRIFTPSSALPACPHGFDDGRGRLLLTAAFAATPHAVSCWYQPTATTAAGPNLSGAMRGLADAFGQPGRGHAVDTVSRARSSGSELIDTASRSGWTVASWLVTNARAYGITRVSYRGYRWTAGLGETSWQADPAAGGTGIVAS